MQKICHYIDFNIANMQIICKKKYAKNMLNMQQKYAKICNQYAEYEQVFVLAYFAYICTPHFADGSSSKPVLSGTEV